ncbi:MAG: ABC transporter permease [Planctomycetes bacterium]|nr:ABC transporter permease [Planctomycetota bacterium]
MKLLIQVFPALKEFFRGLVLFVFRAIEHKLTEFGQFCVFLNKVIRNLFPPYARFTFFYRQFIDAGILSIPIILVVGSFVGMVLAVMTYKQFSILGIESLIGPFIAVPMVSQLGPIMTALMILCRVGSAMTAELGTMRVTEQIDALSCFGINPIRTLIIPRIVMCSLMLPALTIVSDRIGILGGRLLAVDLYGVNEHYYLFQTQKYFQSFDVFVGIFKGFIFGIIISVICCFKGYHTRGGASGVGKSIMAAVVICFIVIIVMNFVLSLVAVELWEKYGL